MDFSVREAKAQFSAALSAAERGERVTVTRHGKPIAEIVPYVADVNRVDWARAAEVRAQLGITPLAQDWLQEFNDPALSRAVLGLDD